MDAELATRAVAAAAALAQVCGLPVESVVVLHDSNRLTLRLLPCDVVARVAVAGHEIAALEVEFTQRLAASSCPVATTDPRIEPGVFERDGFVVTFWTYYAAVIPDPFTPRDHADALRRLHVGMRHVEFQTPHCADRVAAAERLVTNMQDTPELSDDDRHLLVGVLHGAREQIAGPGAAEQLLHGEPHPGNLLGTQDGLRFIDFETVCRGPVEFDVAHLSEEASAHYPDLDPDLLQVCRRLVLAMVAAWRWGVRDEFPNRIRHGRNILTVLRAGPPWPALGALAGH